MGTVAVSAYAKSIVGAVAAVLIAAITAWQSATSDGFQLVDLIPVGIALAGALLTYVIPNVPELPAAKAWVSAVLAVLTALSTGLTGLSPKADAVQTVFALAGAFLTWYVPNLPAQNLVVAPADDQGVHTVTDVPPAPAPPGPVVAPADPTPAALAHLDALDAEDAATERSRMGEAAWTAPAAPTLPIEAEALTAAAAHSPAPAPGPIATA